MRVDYHSGLARHSEFVCLEHDGFPGKVARGWWATRAPGMPVPARVVDALAMRDRLRVPTHIKVRPDGQYTKVVGARF
jgi:DNA repair protein RadD